MHKNARIVSVICQEKKYIYEVYEASRRSINKFKSFISLSFNTQFVSPWFLLTYFFLSIYLLSRQNICLEISRRKHERTSSSFPSRQGSRLPIVFYNFANTRANRSHKNLLILTHSLLQRMCTLNNLVIKLYWLRIR